MNKAGWSQAERYHSCSLHPFWPRVESVVVYHVALVSTFTSAFMGDPSPLLEKEIESHSSILLNIQKTKIMASSPIISWQIEGEKLESVTDFIFLHSKITVTIAMKLKGAFSLGEKLEQT